MPLYTALATELATKLSNRPCKMLSFKSDSDTTGLPYRELTADQKAAQAIAAANRKAMGGRGSATGWGGVQG